MSFNNTNTKPFSIKALKEAMREVAEDKPNLRYPLYVVGVKDWNKIREEAAREGISEYSAYLQLLHSGEVRPAFEV